MPQAGSSKLEKTITPRRKSFIETQLIIQGRQSHQLMDEKPPKEETCTVYEEME